MFTKAVVMVLAAAAVTAITVAAAPGGDDGRDQTGAPRVEPVILSAAEQADVRKGKIVLKDVANPGLKGRTFEAIGTLTGTLDEVLAVILDYRNYHQFMPRVERTIVTDEAPGVALVEQHLRLPLGLTRKYRLRYTACVGEDAFRVDWVKVAWPELPLSHSVADTSGHWQVVRMPEGGLLAVYHVYTDPGRVPLGMKSLALSFSRHDVPKLIEAVRSRLRSAAGTAPIKD
jgi:hypothetical protein